jgi:DNA modification methylase
MNKFRLQSNGFALSRDLVPKLININLLKPLGHETRKHPAGQIRKLATSLERFGFVLPLLLDDENRVIAGGALVGAAERLGLSEVPCVTISGLSEAETRSLRLALNRLGEDSSWIETGLKAEFESILALDSEFDLTFSGFELGEIDLLLEPEDKADEVPEVATEPVSKLGDLWLLGPHRLLCADATKSESYEQLMAGKVAQAVFTDPPYNVPVSGNVSGLGQVKHDDFAMASGEMTREQFTAFLRTVFLHLKSFSCDGSMHFACIDWRHVGEMLEAAEGVYSELKAMCVWAKSAGAMGSLYRSQHELVLVWKNGKKPHINNVNLGSSGRYRTNVWNYSGANTFGAERLSELALHPTVKPVQLIADAILDVSRPNGLVLDPFCGSGSTIIAAERTRRIVYAMELDPKYVDVSIARFEKYTGSTVVHAETGKSFAEIKAERKVSS